MLTPIFIQFLEVLKLDSGDMYRTRNENNLKLSLFFNQKREGKTKHNNPEKKRRKVRRKNWINCSIEYSMRKQLRIKALDSFFSMFASLCNPISLQIIVKPNLMS